jgi:chaperonin GroES
MRTSSYEDADGSVGRVSEDLSRDADGERHPLSGTGHRGKLPIKMLHDRLLVSLSKEAGERRSSGGIVIPATAQMAKRLVWGEVVGVGNHVRQIKPGDQVLFSPEDQHEVEVRGESLIILRERDAHAVAAEGIEESTGLYL